jgi:hypothetical protein
MQPGNALDVVLRRCHDAQLELDEVRQHVASAQRALGLTETSALVAIGQEAVAGHIHKSKQRADVEKQLAKWVKKRTALEVELSPMKRECG